MNGKIMRKKNSLMWGGSYQNEGAENKTWRTPTSEGLSVGEPASVVSFKGKDKGPAFEKQKKWWIEEKVWNLKRLIERRSDRLLEKYMNCVRRKEDRSTASLLCFPFSFISKKSFLLPKHFCTKIKFSFSLAIGDSNIFDLQLTEAAAYCSTSKYAFMT